MLEPYDTPPSAHTKLVVLDGGDDDVMWMTVRVAFTHIFMLENMGGTLDASPFGIGIKDV